MSHLVFTPLAEADLGEILDYIAEHRPLTAVAVITRIREKCDLLASQPLIGQERPEFPGNYRSFPVDRWILFLSDSSAKPSKFTVSLTEPETSTALSDSLEGGRF